MNTIPWSPAHARSRRAIAAYFCGRAAPPAERAMRAHLADCASCQRLYDRHLILAHLDPRALSAQDRIAASLGFRSRPARRWGRWIGGLVVPVAAAAAFALLPRQHLQTDRADPFGARGVESSTARAPSFWMYRIGRAGAPKLADRTIGAADELAFAYSNPGSKRFLMIFGVDEHRHVYWFHPSWSEGQAPPLAITASAGPGPHELQEAIHHDVDARRLEVYAAFSERQLDASIVEANVRRARDVETLPALGDDVVMIRRAFDVSP